MLFANGEEQGNNKRNRAIDFEAEKRRENGIEWNRTG